MQSIDISLEYKKAWDVINGSSHITLIPHINPDADGIGSALGLYGALKKMGKECVLYCYTEDMPRELDFLEGYGKFRHEMPKKTELVIALDSARLDRLGLDGEGYKILNIDHHISSELFGDVNLVDCSCSSTTSVVYKLLKQNGIKIDKNVADALYTGLVTDTGFFTNEDISFEVFDIAGELVKCGCNPSYVAEMLTKREPLAKLRLLSEVLNTLELRFEANVSTMYLTQDMLQKTGARLSDAEEFSGLGRTLATVKVALFFRESGDGNIRVSVRSKHDFDSNGFAAIFGGGGHKKAAGFTLQKTSLKDAIEIVAEKIGSFWI